MRRDECDCTANSPASCCLLASKLVAAYAAFALFGFLFGFHWLVVAACSWRRRRDWLTALLHFAKRPSSYGLRKETRSALCKCWRPTLTRRATLLCKSRS